jgi:hypothetical protein
MKPEELDKATADEAWRIMEEGQDVAVIAARLAREGYRPPEPVDPDVLVVREIVAKVFDEKGWRDAAGEARKGQTDKGATLLAAFDAYKAGREQEQERAKVLVEPAEAIVNRAVHGTGSNGARWVHIVKAARRLEKGLTAYKAGKAAP